METTKWTIAHGALPNARCRFDITPLSIAAKAPSQEIIEYLFDAGASVKFGQPLHYAVRHRCSQAIIELLLNKEASVIEIMFSNDPASYHQFECLGVSTPLHEWSGSFARRFRTRVARCQNQLESGTGRSVECRYFATCRESYVALLA